MWYDAPWIYNWQDLVICLMSEFKSLSRFNSWSQIQTSQALLIIVRRKLKGQCHTWTLKLSLGQVNEFYKQIQYGFLMNLRLLDWKENYNLINQYIGALWLYDDTKSQTTEQFIMSYFHNSNYIRPSPLLNEKWLFVNFKY